ncbi:citrate lyase holo-[acyl-carrier protein] synthase [Lactobacillus ultunensis]|uniref:citrate lyase holo-[acyl-carrier protein] synthase n=1 Tax=Lactobacillus ultunensis DSM 16047 TaxID=525365 RepID=C2EK98_9LACO|nr:citrate lyase holo-[acyl-carrier protein] synthase [Lactobacillus ultunensis]EEJ73113.1 holo-ACP synthase CitX [Lactobacillus ultunensis DSM 16047]KRL82619.1 apo-citrate lyase [Lactobacillus ultunensis DSM 16047]QQP29370.1 citrate lyase holo-[acyl-carrier protein] synthase [Lactobacillus ultunensis]
MNIFNEGKPQDIAHVLSAKDKRVALQQAIFTKYPIGTLVDINLNIPGPIKNNCYLEKLFRFGISQLEKKWQNMEYSYRLVSSLDEDTGCENFYILDLPAKVVKKSTVDFEDNTSLGRLFDADVLVKNQAAAISRKDLGERPRRCFLCNRPAKECSRSRRHSVVEMQDYISRLYEKYVK